MRRREFIAVLAAVIPAAGLLLPAHAQTRGIRRIGVIYHGGPYEASIDGLRDGLKAWRRIRSLPHKRSATVRTLSTADTDAYFFVSDFLVIGHAQLVIE